MTIDTILNQPTHQLSIDDLLATIEAEENEPDNNGNLPNGLLWQIAKAQTIDDALAEAKATYQRRFGREPATIWANPKTSCDGVTQDPRIGRGYLLLGPLPKSI